jgi:hypothetical protein
MFKVGDKIRITEDPNTYRIPPNYILTVLDAGKGYVLCQPNTIPVGAYKGPYNPDCFELVETEMSNVKKQYITTNGVIGTVLYEDEKGCLIEWPDVRNFWSHKDIVSALRPASKITRYIYPSKHSVDGFVVEKASDFSRELAIAAIDIIFTDGKVTGVKLVK